MEPPTPNIHPGRYVRQNIIPAKMAIKDAAKLLGVGRPALSNFLNGKAALSPEMAIRLEKAFGANSQELLQMQAEHDRRQQRAANNGLVVGAYVPSFLKITATDIERWANDHHEARSLLSVLLRKLVNSTGQDLSLVDFPGYDQAEKKGWDGRVDAGAATPWIPLGQSGWEFGCNGDPKQKAEKDYAARMRVIPPNERAEMHFVFVTPRNWNGKDKWRKEKTLLGDWKSVRVYDAGDLEQWLEQSLQAQRWLSEKLGTPSDGVYSLEERWQEWASMTEPELPKELFAPSVEHFAGRVKTWIETPSAFPLIICGDSKIEALAFLHCLFEQNDPAFKNLKDRLLVFSSRQALRKLTTSSPAFVPIVITDEAERELGGAYKNRHAIIVRPRNTVDPEPTIILDLLSYEPFRKSLEAMGITNCLRIDELRRESGYSPTILRRRLSKIPAVRIPEWAQDSSATRRLIPMTLVGTWHTQSKGDREILSFLAEDSCDEIERDIAALMKFDDPPIWSAGAYRGVASKIDAFFAVHADVTLKDLDDFLIAAEIVLSEKDPALELPEDKRAFANIYGKSRDHSGALQDGICETLVLLAVHGNDLFGKRLGIDVSAKVAALVRRLLTPLTPESLLSQTRNLPLYAEAAPQEFLRIIEEDIKSADPQVAALMEPSMGIFSSPSRTGLLWALETLAWNPDHLPRVCFVLAKLAERQIHDNWVNKPDHSLNAIFRCWMPQTAATLEDRKNALAALVSKFPAIAWKICVAQLESGQLGGYSHRPRWRNDASGAGQPLKDRGEILHFLRYALDRALTWPSHDDNTLGDLIVNLLVLEEEDQESVWNIVDAWAVAEADENRKAALREKIRLFAFTRRGANRGLTDKTKSRARKTYDLLAPKDIVTRNRWLFEQHWVQEPHDEVEEPHDFDFNNAAERLRRLRINALHEIWNVEGFDGIKALLLKSGAARTIGWHMADGVIDSANACGFLTQCLTCEDPSLIGKLDEAVCGFLMRVDGPVRADITQKLACILPGPLLFRLLKSSPFQHDTWSYVDSVQGGALRERYWHEVCPNWLERNSADANEAIDGLLEAGRPRAAFFSVQFALDEVETSRLHRLLQDLGTSDAEDANAYRVDAYTLSQAFNVLQNRVGVREEEMAPLEFLYMSALADTDHRIPNLEKQLAKSPILFVQAIALAYRRNDGGEDPPEWKPNNPDHSSALASSAYRLLRNARRIPGTDNAGVVNEDELRAWVKEAQFLCRQHGRAEVGDEKIGELLSSPTFGADGVWPCEQIRSVLEECGTSEMATGIQIGVYNSRGVHPRGDGGDQERALAKKYRDWSRKLKFSHPFVASVVEGIAQTYDSEAAREDSEAAIRKRLVN